MRAIYGWWFSEARVLPHGDGRPIVTGETHTVDGPLVLCQHGLHLSRCAIDALSCARGPLVWRVMAGGEIIEGTDKLVCSELTYVAGGIDVSDTLRHFSRLSALDVIHLWDAPDIVVRYLRTGDESLRAAARAAASAAARDTQNRRLERMLREAIR